MQEEQHSSTRDPVAAFAAFVAEEVEEEPCSVRLRHSALLGQAQRLQMDPDSSPASLVRQLARYVAVTEASQC